MSEETAYLITNVLKGVLSSNGTSPNGKVANFDMAGKSGSSTFDDSAYYNYGIDVVNSTKDSWMIGYTTAYTVAVWQGADMVDSAAKALSSEQANTTQVIMADVMKKVSDKQVPATFEKPAGIETKNGVEYAKERNKETDYMYAGTDRDAVYQAAIAQKQRDSRSALTTVFNSLTNSTNRANTTQRQTTGRTTAGNAAQTNRATNQNRR
jgi:penicillin-binding protein 1A/1B